MCRMMNRWLGGLLVVALVLSLLPALVAPAPAVAAPTTSVTINKYNAYGTLISTATRDWEWMMNNLPVYGDGATHYYMHGPTFDDSSYDLLWDPIEMVNIDSRDYGAAMGTDVKDLCDLVGGATAGCTVKIKAADNFAKWFDYDDIYNPEPEQGKMIVTWYTKDTAEGISGYVSSGSSGTYPTGYTTGMRLLFFAETVNPEGKYVFGDWDMHETIPASRWHYYFDGSYWPSSSGLSVQIVSEINIYEPNLISCDASGSTKDSFAPGETVYVKGACLTASTSYRLWIQGEPVLLKPLNALDRPEGTYTLTAANDPSGAQESITTDASGDFGPVAIWSIDSSATSGKYDIVADNQGAGTVGTYDSNDKIDNPGWQGFSVSEPPLTITASAGASGSIAPSGSVSVPYGGSQAFTIIPNTGYHVADVLVDGSSVGAVTSYTFTNVTADHTISASFAINTYTITASAGDHGSMAPSGSVPVNYGASQTFAITPSDGYRVEDVLVDGSSVGAVTSYTFTNVAANHTISASFAEGTAPDWDLNGDGVINIGDVVVVGLHWGETGTPGWIPQDLNNDGVVNIGDVVVIGLHWGETW
ncbi:MAG: hypothetical protein JW753_01250 [Dehalococcoidia bacterium]|nr:hypothetical protein [Dehalococcoidia bacterium]